VFDHGGEKAKDVVYVACGPLYLFGLGFYARFKDRCWTFRCVSMQQWQRARCCYRVTATKSDLPLYLRLDPERASGSAGQSARGKLGMLLDQNIGRKRWQDSS